MRPSYHAVIFDIAGTTVVDKGNVAESFREAFDHFELTVPSSEIQKVMGWRKTDAIKILLDKFYPSLTTTSPMLVGHIHDRFTENMIDFYTHDKTLKSFPETEEVFSWLHKHHIKIALNTGFTRKITDIILHRLNWVDSPLINMVVTSDEVPEGRPAPYMIEKIIRELQIPNSTSVVKVGDTEVDIQEGRNANCGLVIAVTTGAYSRAQLTVHHPDAIIENLSDLPALLL